MLRPVRNPPGSLFAASSLPRPLRRVLPLLLSAAFSPPRFVVMLRPVRNPPGLPFAASSPLRPVSRSAWSRVLSALVPSALVPSADPSPSRPLVRPSRLSAPPPVRPPELPPGRACFVPECRKGWLKGRISLSSKKIVVSCNRTVGMRGADPPSHRPGPSF